MLVVKYECTYVCECHNTYLSILPIQLKWYDNDHPWLTFDYIAVHSYDYYYGMTMK